MQINYENALRFLDTYFDTYDNHIGRQCYQLIRSKAEAHPQADNISRDAIALCKRWEEFMPKGDSDCPMQLAALLRLMEGVAQRHPC